MERKLTPEEYAAGCRLARDLTREMGRFDGWSLLSPRLVEVLAEAMGSVGRAIEVRRRNPYGVTRDGLLLETATAEPQNPLVRRIALAALNAAWRELAEAELVNCWRFAYRTVQARACEEFRAIQEHAGNYGEVVYSNLLPTDWPALPETTVSFACKSCESIMWVCARGLCWKLAEGPLADWGDAFKELARLPARRAAAGPTCALCRDPLCCERPFLTTESPGVAAVFTFKSWRAARQTFYAEDERAGAPNPLTGPAPQANRLEAAFSAARATAPHGGNHPAPARNPHVPLLRPHRLAPLRGERPALTGW